MKNTLAHEPGLYAIERIYDGKRYIGSSVDLRTRMNAHINHLVRGVHHNGHLQNAWNQIGPEGFCCLRLEGCSVEALLGREAEIIAATPNRFNLANDTTAPMLGLRHRDESKELMSRNRRGKYLDAARARAMGETRRGRKLSDAHRAAMSATHSKRDPNSTKARPVRVITPTGEVVHFPSGKQAAKFLERSTGLIYRAIASGREDIDGYKIQLDATADRA